MSRHSDPAPVRHKWLRGLFPRCIAMTPTDPHRESLARLRLEIESVDRSIVLLLAARLDAAQRALRTRTVRDRRTTDLAQERRVLRRARGWARELGLPEALVESLFSTLIEEGKARFASGRPVSDPLPVVTVLMSAPTGPELRNGARPQLVAVPAPR